MPVDRFTPVNNNRQVDASELRRMAERVEAYERANTDASMEYLQSSQGLVLSTQPTAALLWGDIHYFRMRTGSSSGPTASYAYPAGIILNGISSPNAHIPPGSIVGFPFIAGLGGSLVNLYAQYGGGGTFGLSKVRYGVYDVLAANDISPGALLYDSGDILISTVAGANFVAQPSINFRAVAASSLVVGAGYQVGDLLTVQGGSGLFSHSAVLSVSSVNSSGGVTGVTINDPGAYAVAPINPVSVSGGNGSGEQFNLVLSNSFSLSQGHMYWFCVQNNDNAVFWNGWSAFSFFPIFGFIPALGSGAQAGIGISKIQTYGTYPNPFGSFQVIGGGTGPAFGSSIPTLWGTLKA